jgi:hypothetical protein
MIRKGKRLTHRDLPDLYIRNSHGADRLRHIVPSHEILKSQRVAVFADFTTRNVRTGGTNTDQSSHDNSAGINFAKTFSGFTNPFWKSEIANAQSATTTASGKSIEYSVGFITGEKRIVNAGVNPDTISTEMWGNPKISLPSGGNVSPSDATEANNRAISKFLDKLDSAQSAVEAGQDFGELKETLHGVTNPLSSLRGKLVKYFDSLTKAKSRYRTKTDLHKVLADTYLEFTFGWIPLAKDVGDAIVGLQNADRHFSLIPLQAKGKVAYGGSYTPRGTISSDPFGLMDHYQSARNSSSYKVRYKGMYKHERDGNPPSTSEILQLDLPHFIPTAWDLLPYSFVVDYFTNVGDVVRAYSARKTSLAWCLKTTRQINTAEYYDEIVPRPLSAGQKLLSWRADGCHSRVEVVSFTRAAFDPNSLIPVLRFEIPHGKPWVNIAALLLGRTKALVPFFKPR